METECITMFHRHSFQRKFISVAAKELTHRHTHSESHYSLNDKLKVDLNPSLQIKPFNLVSL